MLNNRIVLKGNLTKDPEYKTISEKDPDLLFIVDTPAEAVKVITDYHTKAKLKPNF